MTNYSIDLGLICMENLVLIMSWLSWAFSKMYRYINLDLANSLIVGGIKFCIYDKIIFKVYFCSNVRVILS